jgi:hypothetical protein
MPQAFCAKSLSVDPEIRTVSNQTARYRIAKNPEKATRGRGDTGTRGAFRRVAASPRPRVSASAPDGDAQRPDVTAAVERPE